MVIYYPDHATFVELFIEFRRSSSTRTVSLENRLEIASVCSEKSRGSVRKSFGKCTLCGEWAICECVFGYFGSGLYK